MHINADLVAGGGEGGSAVREYRSSSRGVSGGVRDPPPPAWTGLDRPGPAWTSLDGLGQGDSLSVLIALCFISIQLHYLEQLHPSVSFGRPLKFIGLSRLATISGEEVCCLCRAIY